ncbi:MAG: TylF/MycF/NovP-related O-methyltransferase [Deltaproteobacteria bacterium]
MDLGRRYLDLLKRTLTGTIYAEEPARSGVPVEKYLEQFIGHYFANPYPHTCVPLARLDNVDHCVRTALADGIAGDLVETGVWRGGVTIYMRAMLDVLGDEERVVWAADSFEGLPRPDPTLYPKEAAAHDGPLLSGPLDNLAVSLEDVRKNFASYGLLDDRVKFLKGWFKDTLPDAPIERIAVLRLDGDYYESTRDPLLALYDKVTEGGFIIVDDYGEDDWTYCRQAIDEFRGARQIDAPIHVVDGQCVYWRKGGDR